MVAKRTSGELSSKHSCNPCIYVLQPILYKRAYSILKKRNGTAHASYPCHSSSQSSTPSSAFASTFGLSFSAVITPFLDAPNRLSIVFCPFSRGAFSLTFCVAETGGRPSTRLFASSSNKTSRSRSSLSFGTDQVPDLAFLWDSLYFDPLRCVEYVLASSFLTY
jgi:hypothetical protein